MSGYTIQELTAGYKDWMSSDGWIFDAEYGHLDGKPANKRDLRVYLTQTPDDELPRRSMQLSWADDTA